MARYKDSRNEGYDESDEKEEMELFNKTKDAQAVSSLKDLVNVSTNEIADRLSKVPMKETDNESYQFLFDDVPELPKKGTKEWQKAEDKIEENRLWRERHKEFEQTLVMKAPSDTATWSNNLGKWVHHDIPNNYNSKTYDSYKSEKWWRDEYDKATLPQQKQGMNESMNESIKMDEYRKRIELQNRELERRNEDLARVNNALGKMKTERRKSEDEAEHYMKLSQKHSNENKILKAKLELLETNPDEYNRRKKLDPYGEENWEK